MVRILFSGLIGGFTGVRLKILRHLSMLVFLLEFAIAGLWLQLSPMCNGQEIFKEAFSWTGIREFLQLWDCLLGFTLTDQEDRHTWRLDSSGC